MTRDWKDLIPASGEAHAQIGLKGRFGGKSNMRRFRRYGGGRRNTKFASYRTRRSNKWWFTYIGADGDGESQNIWDTATGTLNTPQVVVSLEGHNISGSDNPRGSNEQVVRWIGRQGGVELTYRFPDDAAGTPAIYSNADQPIFSLVYAWFKFKQDFAQTLPSNIATQFGMQTSQNLGLILQRKDIIRWGYVDVPRMWSRIATFNGSLASPGQEFGNNVVGNRVRSFLPFPQFPKAGFTITPNDILMCIVQPVDPVSRDTVVSADVGPGYCSAMPVMRLLMAE